MQQVTLNEAIAQLPELIKAAARGEEVLISENGDVVQLVPVAATKQPRKAGSAKGMIVYMADDFDAPLEDFAEYM